MKTKPINVISYFDGMSCGYEALKNSGIEVNKYYAFEIDKYAIQISKKNHPDIIHLGNIEDWKFFDGIETPDLILAGSPCQGFSNAGRGLNFDDPRSKLFFTFVEALNFWKNKNPDMKFLLENVQMKAEWRDVITDYLGVMPVMIDSALVSAQSRKRLYWTNIADIEQPEDRHVYLKDIIEDGYVDRNKSYCIDANYFKGGNPKSYFDKGRRQLVFEFKHQSQKRAMVRIGTADDIKGHDCLKRIYSGEGKSPTLTAHAGGNQEPKIAVNEKFYRKLAPIECERLQCLPDNYTFGVSNTQRYKMIGNGFTVSVLAHIFSKL